MSESFIVTASGARFDLVDLNPDLIVLSDICYALDGINRYTGHTIRPYSVAEHTFLGWRRTEPRYRLEWLFHDATEAYLGDVSSPLKQLLPEYMKLESALDAAICRKFHVLSKMDGVMSREVYETDRRMFATEVRDLFNEPARKAFDVCHEYPPYEFQIPKHTTVYSEALMKAMSYEIACTLGLPWVD